MGWLAVRAQQLLGGSVVAGRRVRVVELPILGAVEGELCPLLVVFRAQAVALVRIKRVRRLARRGSPSGDVAKPCDRIEGASLRVAGSTKLGEFCVGRQIHAPEPGPEDHHLVQAIFFRWHDVVRRRGLVAGGRVAGGHVAGGRVARGRVAGGRVDDRRNVNEPAASQRPKWEERLAPPWEDSMG
jgi:hypothetical protein